MILPGVHSAGDRVGLIAKPAHLGNEHDDLKTQFCEPCRASRAATEVVVACDQHPFMGRAPARHVLIGRVRPASSSRSECSDT